VRQDGGGFEELRPVGAAAREGAHASTAAPAVPVATVDLAPRTSGRILDAALDLARERFGMFVLASAAVWFFSRALQPFVQRYAGPEVLQTGPSDRDAAVFLLLQALNLGVLFVVTSAATLVIAVLCVPLLRGGTQTAGGALALLLRRIPGALVIQLVVGLAVSTLGLCTCGIGWFWIQWKLSLALIVYVLEGQGIGVALSRSFELTSRDGWGWPAFAGFLRWFAVFTTAAVASFFFSGLFAIDDSFPLVRAAVIDRVGAPPWVVDVALVAISTLLQGIATALGSLAMIAYYVDCRARRDGVDLLRRLDALRARSADAARASLAAARAGEARA
jgi:hypothetical protein